MYPQFSCLLFVVGIVLPINEVGIATIPLDKIPNLMAVLLFIYSSVFFRDKISLFISYCQVHTILYLSNQKESIVDYQHIIKENE